MNALGEWLLSACERGDLLEARGLIEEGAPLDATNRVRARPAHRGPHAPL